MSPDALTALVDLPARPGDDSSARTRLAFGVPLRWHVARCLADVPVVIDAAHAAARSGSWCVGWVTYEAAPGLNDALTSGTHVHPVTNEPVLAAFAEFDSPAEAPSPPSGSTWHAAAWAGPLLPAAPLAAPAPPDLRAAIGTIRDHICDGDAYQVNLTTPLRTRLEGDPDDWFAALVRAQPDGYVFRLAHALDGVPERLLCLSPELFFDWAGDTLTAQPMKGTAPRGATPRADADAAQRLVTSDKERAENVMIVDLLRNDLSRVATLGSVRVPRLFERHALPTVWQMTSTITARARPGTTLSQVFGALFPCGSVTGAPKRSAMGIIHTLESEPRGVYCGALGLIRPGGDATFAVPIRTLALRDADGTGRRWDAVCGVGSGITHDSTPDGEAREWRSKQGFLQRAAALFELLETLRLDDGRWWMLEAHLARLQRTAWHFGYRFDGAAVHAALAATRTAHPTGSHRVRLIAGPDGRTRAEAHPLPATPAVAQLRLATGPIDGDSEFVRFKTTRREAYAAFVPTEADRAAGVFDTLLHNRAGELTETTFGNVALRIGGAWLTPAAACGLLPGVYREALLEEGRLREARLPLDAIRAAEACAFLNSVRGWVPVDLDALRAQFDAGAPA